MGKAALCAAPPPAAGWRLEDTTARRGFYEKYLREAEQFDFTFREHGLRVHPLVMQVDLSCHPETARFDLLRQVMCILRQVMCILYKNFRAREGDDEGDRGYLFREREGDGRSSLSL